MEEKIGIASHVKAMFDGVYRFLSGCSAAIFVNSFDDASMWVRDSDGAGPDKARAKTSHQPCMNIVQHVVTVAKTADGDEATVTTTGRVSWPRPLPRACMPPHSRCHDKTGRR